MQGPFNPSWSYFFKVTRGSHWQGKIPNPEIQKILKRCEYVGDFLLITTQILFAAQIHFKGVELTAENPVIFLFFVITREL